MQKEERSSWDQLSSVSEILIVLVLTMLELYHSIHAWCLWISSCPPISETIGCRYFPSIAWPLASLKKSPCPRTNRHGRGLPVEMHKCPRCIWILFCLWKLVKWCPNMWDRPDSVGRMTSYFLQLPLPDVDQYEIHWFCPLWFLLALHSVLQM